MLITTADDLGLSHQVNRAVICAFERGFCSHASVMPNMPGFEEAGELVRMHGLTDRVGLHLVLTEGTPITESMKRCRRFCDRDGRFCLSRKQHITRLSRGEKETLAQEIEAQMARCRKHGIVVAHLDSHSHVHEEWAILPLVIRAARNAGVPRLRLCRTSGGGTSSVKWFYRRIVNLRIRASGLAATEHFGSPDDYALFCQRHGASHARNTPWEVMIHPVFDEQERLCDGWLRRPLEEVMKTLGEARTVVSGMHRRRPMAVSATGGPDLGSL
jgi:predicted glycoside hydrolase/deacetylase ChbG (UPF0249 family)